MTERALKVYDILKELGIEDSKAQEFITYFDEISQTKIERELRNVATKEDIANLRTELKEDIANLKIDMIKWIIGLLIAQTAIILTLVKFIT